MIEAAGVATAVHSWIPELSASVGSPRVIGIGYPGSVPFGAPGDAAGQTAVLRGSLQAAAGIDRPGQRIDLAFEWPSAMRVPRPPTPPPISQAIMRRPWLFLKLLNRQIPEA